MAVERAVIGLKSLMLAGMKVIPAVTLLLQRQLITHNNLLGTKQFTIGENIFVPYIFAATRLIASALPWPKIPDKEVYQPYKRDYASRTSNRPI